MMFKQVRVFRSFADNLFRVWQMIVLRMPEHKYAVFCYYYRITCYGLDIKKTASSDL